MKTRLLIFVLLVALVVGFASAQASTTDVTGVPPEGSGVTDLSGTWRMNTVRFLKPDMTAADFDDSGWMEAAVPAHWDEQGIQPASGLPTVAVYRRTFPTLAEWEGQKIGLSAWLFPSSSTVTLNGTRLEPQGTFPWLYADVTNLLKPVGDDNVLAVSAQFDGIYETTLPNPPRVGVINTWQVPALQETPVSLDINGETIEATAYRLADDTPRPVVLMMGTGSHGLAFTEPFVPLARELAYNGYIAVPVALPAQTPENINAALAALRAMPGVKADSIAVIAAVSSATTMLQTGINRDGLRVMVILSAGNAKVETGLDIPSLLIASSQDATGPTNIYAKRISEALAGPNEVLIINGTQSGLEILNAGWNPVRAAVLKWFDAYLGSSS